MRFADVDYAGIVYYPRYFHYFHLALEEFLREHLGRGGYRGLLDDDRIGFPAVSVNCDYKAPLRFGDLAEIELSIAKRGRTSISLCFRVFRVVDDNSQQPRTLCAQGKTVCAIVDLGQFSAVEMPAKLNAVFDALD